MKRGFSFEALKRISANTKTSQEYALNDADLEEVDENGQPFEQINDVDLEEIDEYGVSERDRELNRTKDLVPTDRELPEWAQTNSGSNGQLPDRQIQIQDNIAMLLPQGPEGESQAAALADIVSDKVTQYGDAYLDVFWAVAGQGDQAGQVDFKMALNVADEALSKNQAESVTKAINEGVAPMDALSAIPLFG